MLLLRAQPIKSWARRWALLESDFFNHFFFLSLIVERSEFQCIYYHKVKTQTVTCKAVHHLLKA